MVAQESKEFPMISLTKNNDAEINNVWKIPMTPVNEAQNEKRINTGSNSKCSSKPLQP